MTKKQIETAMDFLGGLTDDAITPKQSLPVSDLAPDPDQPRKNFDQDALDNLAAAIKSDGILQPLLVRESGGEPPYIITDGERRWRAAQAAGLEEVPCLIRNDIDASRMRFVQAMANVNREDLTDFELATVIQQQLEENPKLKQKNMARLLGISESTVTRLLALLAPEYVELAKAGMIESASTLVQLKKLDDDARAALLEAAQDGQVITRDAIEEAKASAAAEAAAAAVAATPPVSDGGAGDDVQGDDQDDADKGTSAQDAAEAPWGGGDDQGEGLDAPAEGAIATPRDREQTGKAPASATVKLSLKVEDMELLIPYFVDKESEKLDIRMSRDTAAGLLEKLGQYVPDALEEFPDAIRTGIQSLLAD